MQVQCSDAAAWGEGVEIPFAIGIAMDSPPLLKISKWPTALTHHHFHLSESSMRGDSYQLQGQQGAVTISGAGTTTGNFRWILCAADTVISSMSGNVLGVGGASPNTSLSGVTLPAGFGFGGTVTSITLTSGTVIAYTA